jgi:hypothetical protein
VANAEDVARADWGSPIDAAAIGPLGIYLKFDQRGLFAPDQLCPDKRTFRAQPQEGPVRTHPVGTQIGEVANRLHEVRLADAVGPYKDRDPGPELEIDLGIASEVSERKVFKIHAELPVSEAR